MGDLIGVFGGTFDPPHIGHCILAEEAYHQLALDVVYWVPAGEPPHKPDWPISSIGDREKMVESITALNPRFELSRIDIDRPGPHYAKETLAFLHEAQPGANFIYLMGADSLRDLHLWKEPDSFLEKTHAIGVMQRPQVEYDLKDLESRIPGLSEKLRFFPAPLIEISGQIIRQRIKADLPIRYMVTAEVHNLIQSSNLYR